MKRIENLWYIFSTLTMNPQAPPVQRHEMQHAFYAGVASLFSILYGIGGEEISEEQGCKILSEVGIELEEYKVKVVKEAAGIK